MPAATANRKPIAPSSRVVKVAGHKVGHYTAGWIKRGPSGVIGTNKKDALETVQHLLADVGSQTLLSPESPEPDAVEALLSERGVRFVSFEDWQAIDQAELQVRSPEPAGEPTELARIAERLEIEQDDGRVGIVLPVLQQVVAADVGPRTG